MARLGAILNYATADELRDFENDVAASWERGELPYLIHLSGGNEEILIKIFAQINEGDWVFSTHRNHFHALLAGIKPARLRQLIHRGDSMFVFDRQRNFFTSAILSGTACIAVGVAYALKEKGSNNRVWCFNGDGGEENGHFAEAVTMTEGHDLPITFIIENNDRAVGSPIYERVPSGYRIAWPERVLRYDYKPRWPHAGNGTQKKIVFK